MTERDVDETLDLIVHAANVEDANKLAAQEYIVDSMIADAQAAVAVDELLCEGIVDGLAQIASVVPFVQDTTTDWDVRSEIAYQARQVIFDWQERWQDDSEYRDALNRLRVRPFDVSLMNGVDWVPR